MNSSPLIGKKMIVIANDFIQVDMAACITYANEPERKLLLEIDNPITISGVTYTHAVASPRLAKDDFNILLKFGTLGCSVTWVPKDRFDPNKPLDLSWWRGGAAAITDVMLS